MLCATVNNRFVEMLLWPKKANLGQLVSDKNGTKLCYLSDQIQVFTINRPINYTCQISKLRGLKT